MKFNSHSTSWRNLNLNPLSPNEIGQNINTRTFKRHSIVRHQIHIDRRTLLDLLRPISVLDCRISSAPFLSSLNCSNTKESLGSSEVSSSASDVLKDNPNSRQQQTLSVIGVHEYAEVIWRLDAGRLDQQQPGAFVVVVAADQ